MRHRISTTPTTPSPLLVRHLQPGQIGMIETSGNWIMRSTHKGFSIFWLRDGSLSSLEDFEDYKLSRILNRGESITLTAE